MVTTWGGKRPILLMLHGGGPGVDAASNWRGVRDSFAERFECLAPDLLGFGGMVGHGPRPTPSGPTAWARARADQILELLDHRAIERTFVLGNSAAGGAAALALMERAPARVRRAVVMGGAGTAGVPARVPFYGEPTRESMRSTLASLVADAEAQVELIDELADERYERAMQPGAEVEFRAMFAPDPPGTSRIDRSMIAAPVLAIHGGADRVNPPSVSQALAQDLAHGEWTVIPGAGHWIHVDRPAEFCRAAIEFLLRPDDEN